MNLKLLLLLAFTALLFASCAHVYSPALYHQDIVYQPKPTSFDTAKSANYISAGMNTNFANNFDGVLSGQLNLSRAHVFNNFNLAYGAFGEFGEFNNGGSIQKGQPNYFVNKYFGAVGGRASGNLFVTSGRADIRFIGFEVAYSHEYGSYADFRQSVKSLNNYYVDPRTDLFSVGLTSEVIFHTVNNDGFQHGIRVFLGTTLGHNDLEDTYYNYYGTMRLFRNIYPKASYFIKIKNYFGTFEIGDAIFIRFGLKF